MVWADTGGRTRATLLDGNATLASVQAALQNHSQADILFYIEGPQVGSTPAPAGGVFPSVGDTVRLTFTDASGNMLNVVLPAPSANIFLADSVTVDATMIGDIITAVVGTVLSAAGNPATAFVAGLRGVRGQGA